MHSGRQVLSSKEPKRFSEQLECTDLETGVTTQVHAFVKTYIFTIQLVVKTPSKAKLGMKGELRERKEEIF